MSPITGSKQHPGKHTWPEQTTSPRPPFSTSGQGKLARGLAFRTHRLMNSSCLTPFRPPPVPVGEGVPRAPATAQHRRRNPSPGPASSGDSDRRVPAEPQAQAPALAPRRAPGRVSAHWTPTLTLTANGGVCPTKRCPGHPAPAPPPTLPTRATPGAPLKPRDPVPETWRSKMSPHHSAAGALVPGGSARVRSQPSSPLTWLANPLR